MAVLRLLRLLRVLKLFKAVPQLQIIMSGLAQGMGSIVWIALLLGLMFYLFGIVAIMFFRPNDPVHFGSLDVTFLTLFRASTFEDWTDIMFVAMYGCQKWRSVFPLFLRFSIGKCRNCPFFVHFNKK